MPLALHPLDFHYQASEMASAFAASTLNAHNVVRLQEFHEYNLLTSKAQAFLEKLPMDFVRRGRFSRRRTKHARNDDTRSIVRELHIAAELVAVFFPPMPMPWRYRDPNALVRRGVKARLLIDDFGASLGMMTVMRATEIVVRERENNRMAMQLGRLMREGRQQEECPYCVAGVEHVKHEEPLPVYEEGGARVWQSDEGLPSYDDAAAWSDWSAELVL
ncbi:hypothetical protein H2201_004399 [Coniosporium apollinis]|uniref:Uncharacterized protein n=1 Tax=Coniosporium apollinis TaxID=61459 RepID=A0ABQ9NTQ5_9PEZI|nr:hypothetical protein H2201_004399 [Coniosporium apollinis]